MNAYTILVGMPKRNRPLGKPRRSCEFNIIMDLRELELDVIDWIHLAEDRDSCEYGSEPSGSIKWGNPSVTERLVASQEGLASME
jgi:hypothetical protein